MALKLPRGQRVWAEIKLGQRLYVIRPKVGTAQILGLPVKPPTEVKRGKGGVPLPGVVGTKSYTMIFKKPQSIGGATVRTVDIPIPGEAKLVNVLKFAYDRRGLIAGIITPWGRSYYWSKSAGGGPVEQDIVDKIDNTIDNAEDWVNQNNPIIPDFIENPVDDAVEGAIDVVGDKVDGLDDLIDLFQRFNE